MKEFYKDYVELCKVTGRFYKKHWKGVLAVNVAIVGAELAYFAYQNKKMERLFSNPNKEEEAQ